MVTIKELVFNGGGAKGAGMPGVYFALCKSNKWDEIEAIAGTSVGSLSAALFSVSPDQQKFAKFIQDNNFNERLSISYTFFPWYMRQERLKEFVNNFLNDEIKTFLSTNTDPQLVVLKKNLNDESYKITFGDMQLLSTVDRKKFKQLTFVSVKTNSADKVIHNATNSQNMAICDACAASCSLPYVFEKCIVDNEHHLDGGLRDPLPSECFSDNSAAKQKQRLIFVFGSGPFSFSNLWRHALENSPKVTFQCVKNFSERDEEANRILIEYILDSNESQIRYKKLGSNQEFTIAYSELKLEESATENEMHDKLLDFCKILKERNHIPYLFGYYNPIWFLDFISPIISYIIGFPVLIINLFEEIAQRLQTYYPDNTVCLDSGSIEPIYFYKAEKLKSTLCAIYYLDTLLHLKEDNLCKEIYNQYKNIDQNANDYSPDALLAIKQYASRYPYSQQAKNLTAAYENIITLQSDNSFASIPSK